METKVVSVRTFSRSSPNIFCNVSTSNKTLKQTNLGRPRSHCVVFVFIVVEYTLARLKILHLFDLKTCLVKVFEMFFIFENIFVPFTCYFVLNFFKAVCSFL